MVREKQILVVWEGKECSSKTRMFTGPHSSLIPHSIKAGSPAPLTFEVIWCWILLVITHCSVSCGLMYTSSLLSYPQTTFSWSLLLLPSLILYLTGSHYLLLSPSWTTLQCDSLFPASPSHLQVTSPSPSNKHCWHISLPKSSTNSAFQFHYSSLIYRQK